MSRQNNRTLAPHYVSLAVLTALAFALTGCSSSNDEHEDHDHDEHAGQDHSEHSAPPPTTKIAVDITDDYPLATCVVSGEPLEAMGGHVSIQYEGREVRFCCKDCAKSFKKEPHKYLALLDKAASGQPVPEHDTTEHEHHDHSGHEH